MDGPPVFEMAGLTDVGRVRDHNEDAICWDEAAGWAILADGMGGHLAGEVASEMAVETIAGRLSALAAIEATVVSETLLEAIAGANCAIRKHAQSNPLCSNMGTTVMAVMVHDGWLAGAYVGDSRLYRFNRDGLSLLSRDHSLVQELMDEGVMSREEAAVSVHRNVITRALGAEASVEPDLLRFPVEEGDLFLLCSDGLSDALPEAEMERLLNSGNLSAMAQALVDEANARGGADNISLILLRQGPSGD